jgi:hypothetical protein
MLYKNCIYTNFQSKGEVLGTFIDSWQHKPTLIISFDDQLKYLYSIAQACKKRNIPFIGYHYIGVAIQQKSFKYNYALEQLHKFIKDPTCLATRKCK